MVIKVQNQIKPIPLIEIKKELPKQVEIYKYLEKLSTLSGR